MIYDKLHAVDVVNTYICYYECLLQYSTAQFILDF